MTRINKILTEKQNELIKKVDDVIYKLHHHLKLAIITEAFSESEIKKIIADANRKISRLEKKNLLVKKRNAIIVQIIELYLPILEKYRDEKITDSQFAAEIKKSIDDNFGLRSRNFGSLATIMRKNKEHTKFFPAGSSKDTGWKGFISEILVFSEIEPNDNSVPWDIFSDPKKKSEYLPKISFLKIPIKEKLSAVEKQDNKPRHRAGTGMLSGNVYDTYRKSNLCSVVCCPRNHVPWI